MKFWPLSRKYFFCSRMSEFCRKFAVFVRKLQLSATPTFFNPPTPRVSSIRTAEARALFIFIPRLHDKTGSTSWLYYVSWTSQLDVCSTFARRLLDVCLMSARCLLDRVNGVLDTSCNVVNIVSMKSRILLLKIILGKNERTDQHFFVFSQWYRSPEVFSETRNVPKLLLLTAATVEELTTLPQTSYGCGELLLYYIPIFTMVAWHRSDWMLVVHW